MGALWNLPARYEGPHSELGRLVRQEAYRHVAIAHVLDADLAEDPEDHMRRIESFLWNWVTIGWCRPEPDFSVLLFWHPVLEEFVPYDAALQMVYVDVLSQLRSLGNATPYTGRAQVPQAPEQAYVGRRPTPVGAGEWVCASAG